MYISFFHNRIYAHYVLYLRVYSDWTVSDNLTAQNTTRHMLVNRSIQTGASQRSDSCMCWNSFDYCRVAKPRQGNKPIRCSSLVSNANNNNRIVVSTPEYHNRFESGFTSISMMWTFKHDIDADPFNQD